MSASSQHSRSSRGSAGGAMTRQFAMAWGPVSHASDGPRHRQADRVVAAPFGAYPNDNDARRGGADASRARPVRTEVSEIRFVMDDVPPSRRGSAQRRRCTDRGCAPPARSAGQLVVGEIERALHDAAQVCLDGELVLGGRRHDASRDDDALGVELVAVQQEAPWRFGRARADAGPGGTSAAGGSGGCRTPRVAAPRRRRRRARRPARRCSGRDCGTPLRARRRRPPPGRARAGRPSSARNGRAAR